MRMLVTTAGRRGEVESHGELAVGVRAFGAEVPR